MAEGTIAPFPFHIFFDANGTAPLAGGLVYTYEAGTTTAAAVYTDADLTVPHANPIVLNAAGYPPSPIYLPPAAFKWIAKTAAGVTVWTADNINATPRFDVDLDITGTAGEAIAAGECVYCSDGSGALTAGRWYLTDGDLPYASLGAKAVGFASAAIASAAEGTIRIAGRLTGLAGLAAGSVYYCSGTAGEITATAPACPRIVGEADSATSLIINALTAPRNILTNLDSEATAVGNVGAGEDDLQSWAMPAGTLTTAGTGVRILAWGTTTSNVNAKTIKLYFGTDLLVSLSATVSEAGKWMIGAHVMRTAAATQLAVAQGACGPASSAITATSGNVSSPTQTLTAAVTIKCTGEATANDDIIQTGMVVRLS